MRDVLHVTLQTGHTRMSPRSEIGAGVTETLAPLLDRALTGEHVGLPELPGYTWTAAPHGRCCVVTLWAQHTEGMRPEPVPLLTIGVAGHSRCGAELWRVLHERGDLAYVTDPAEQPPTPWLADRLDVGMALYPDAASWSGDWARCIAWTYLESRETRWTTD